MTSVSQNKACLIALFCVSVMVMASLVCLTYGDINDANKEPIGEKERYGELKESNATSFWSEKIKYEVDGKNTVKVIDYDGGYREIVVPDTVEYKGMTYTVDRIAEDGLSSTFGRLPHSVSIGPNVEWIDEAAIDNGKLLFRKDNVYTETFVIRDVEHSKLKTVGFYALARSHIESVVLPTPIVISDGAFLSCKSLKNVTFVGGGEVTVYADAFKENYSLESIDLSMTPYIGGDAFHDCKNLRKVIVGNSDGVMKTEIFIESFKGLEKLREITFGNIAHIENDAFGSKKFMDASGKVIKRNAQNLSNHTFVYDAKRNAMVMVGNDFLMDSVNQSLALQGATSYPVAY